jgi:hypothetical protein
VNGAAETTAIDFLTEIQDEGRQRIHPQSQAFRFGREQVRGSLVYWAARRRTRLRAGRHEKSEKRAKPRAPSEARELNA